MLAAARFADSTSVMVECRRVKREIGDEVRRRGEETGKDLRGRREESKEEQKSRGLMEDSGVDCR